MEIKTKLTEKDFFNVNFVLLYSKFYAKFIAGVAILILLFDIWMILFGTSLKSSSSSSSGVTQFVVPLVMLAWLPLFTYFVAKRSFASNKRIQETIEYKFEAGFLVIQGESFSSQLSWDKLYKVTQTKNWILIWQNRSVANVIPKKDVWEGRITDLKEILNRNQVKNNL